MNTEEAATVLQIASTLDESEDKNLMTVATILRGMLGEIQRLGTESGNLRADLAARDAEIERIADDRDAWCAKASTLEGENLRLQHEKAASVNLMRAAQERKKIADRVLGEGEVAVDREELGSLRHLLDCARVAAHAVEDEGECDMSSVCGAVFACDSLRAQTTQEPAKVDDWLAAAWIDALNGIKSIEGVKP